MVKKMIAKPKKKLTPASIYSRKPRREAFDVTDRNYLSGKEEVSLGGEIGGGSSGVFYYVKGNKNMGVKVPHCTANRNDDDDICEYCTDKENILDEFNLVKMFDYNGKPFLSPSHLITVNRKGRKCIGIVRPIVTPITYRNAKQLTDSQLEAIRKSLISLARDGIVFGDGLQFGFTADGRLLQFDLGSVRKVRSTEAAVVKFGARAAFHNNDNEWSKLLHLAGRYDHCDILSTDSAWRRCCDEVASKYGKVE
jgi:hypothetical protein